MPIVDQLATRHYVLVWQLLLDNLQTVDPNAFQIRNAKTTWLASTKNVKILVQDYVVRMPNVEFLVTLRCVPVYPDTLEIHFHSVLLNKVRSLRFLAHARPIHVDQMLFADNRTMLVLANASQIIREIRTKAVDPNAFLMPIVHRIEHA